MYNKSEQEIRESMRQLKEEVFAIFEKYNVTGFFSVASVGPLTVEQPLLGATQLSANIIGYSAVCMATENGVVRRDPIDGTFVTFNKPSDFESHEAFQEAHARYAAGHVALINSLQKIGMSLEKKKDEVQHDHFTSLSAMRDNRDRDAPHPKEVLKQMLNQILHNKTPKDN